MMTPTQTTIKALAEQFEKRANNLGLSRRSKKRDEAALEFFMGAMAMAELEGNKALFDHISKVAFFSLSIRGFDDTLKMVKGWDEKTAA